MTARQAPAQVVPPVRRGRARWRRRWFRAVVPFAVVALLAGVTAVARYAEEPQLRRDSTLTPDSTARDGSSELARQLAGRGVRIDRVATIQEAMDAILTGEDSVVFIPKPTQFGAGFAGIVPYAAGDHKVVMVAPNQRQLLLAGAFDIGRGPTRWASRATEPGCTVPEAVAAGRASALRSRYQVVDPDRVCYQGGLVSTTVRYQADARSELVVVGSADPFRNRRIGEHGNATLAVDLLASHGRVIWADALPFDLDWEWPQFPGFGRPRLPEVRPPPRSDVDRSPGSVWEQLVAGYDPRILAGLALLGVLAVLVALARARRLGPPVSEPLPVLVPAAEVVAGRGRLYQRVRGRGVALASLRAAAIRRLLPALGLGAAPTPEPDTVVAAVAGRIRLPDAHVRHILYGPDPDTDEELTQAVAALDTLVESVTREGGPP